ncbi:hypothetical protein PR048_030418 [Dryococelus australis]|uniref:Uncharacterized protein n=1 Tax=Dryococelus australis TaxID=614101 RepID=A0ABQ9G9Q2_9NEOP|nr:hypothetical protein PR048_030418 [Dryococelus australis]
MKQRFTRRWQAMEIVQANSTGAESTQQQKLLLIIFPRSCKNAQFNRTNAKEKKSINQQYTPTLAKKRPLKTAINSDSSEHHGLERLTSMEQNRNERVEETGVPEKTRTQTALSGTIPTCNNQEMEEMYSSIGTAIRAPKQQGKTLSTTKVEEIIHSGQLRCSAPYMRHGPSPLLEVSTGLATMQECSGETGCASVLHDALRELGKILGGSRRHYILPQLSGRQSSTEAAWPSVREQSELWTTGDCRMTAGEVFVVLSAAQASRPGGGVQSLVSSAEVSLPQAMHGIIKQHECSGEKSPSIKKSRMSSLSPMRSQGEKSRQPMREQVVGNCSHVELKSQQAVLERIQLPVAGTAELDKFPEEGTDHGGGTLASEGNSSDSNWRQRNKIGSGDSCRRYICHQEMHFSMEHYKSEARDRGEGEETPPKKCYRCYKWKEMNEDLAGLCNIAFNEDTGNAKCTNRLFSGNTYGKVEVGKVKQIKAGLGNIVGQEGSGMDTGHPQGVKADGKSGGGNIGGRRGYVRRTTGKCAESFVIYHNGKNKIKINVRKTKVVRFTRKKIRRDKYRWERQEIEEAAEYKYVGIVLQGDLRWKKNRVLNGVSCEVKEKTYGIMAQPMLEYAAAVWDPYVEMEVRKLKRCREGQQEGVIHITELTSTMGALQGTIINSYTPLDGHLLLSNCHSTVPVPAERNRGATTTSNTFTQGEATLETCRPFLCRRTSSGGIGDPYSSPSLNSPHSMGDQWRLNRAWSASQNRTDIVNCVYFVHARPYTLGIKRSVPCCLTLECTSSIYTEVTGGMGPRRLTLARVSIDCMSAESSRGLACSEQEIGYMLGSTPKEMEGVCPHISQDQVLAKVHSGNVAGHPGVDQTIKNEMESFNSKKSAKHYVGHVLEEDNTSYMMKFMTITKDRSFFFPEKEDISLVELCDVKQVLDNPICNRLQNYSFKNLDFGIFLCVC